MCIYYSSYILMFFEVVVNYFLLHVPLALSFPKKYKKPTGYFVQNLVINIYCPWNKLEKSYLCLISFYKLSKNERKIIDWEQILHGTCKGLEMVYKHLAFMVRGHKWEFRSQA